jgi:hypothetical protein
VKKRILASEVNPLFALINEPRKEFNVRGFNSAFSMPVNGAADKINCSILIHNSLQFAERKKEVDYVSVIVTGPPL